MILGIGHTNLCGVTLDGSTDKHDRQTERWNTLAACDAKLPFALVSCCFQGTIIKSCQCASSWSRCGASFNTIVGIVTVDSHAMNLPLLRHSAQLTKTSRIWLSILSLDGLSSTWTVYLLEARIACGVKRTSWERLKSEPGLPFSTATKVPQRDCILPMIPSQSECNWVSSFVLWACD